MELFQQSRALGNTSSILNYNLDASYELGLGVPKDYLEAQRLIALASVQGFATATDGLARIDEKVRTECTECALLGEHVRVTATSREDLNARMGKATFSTTRGIPW